MAIGSTLEDVFEIQGAFYEMAKLILEPDIQKDYYQKKEIAPEMETLVTGNFKMDNVKFEYPSKPEVPVLKKIAIHVNNNEFIAIVG